MAGKKITVVLSQAQGKNPQRRHLEEEIATALIMAPDVDCSVVPHLYDMSHDHTGMLFLRSVPGDLIVLSWLFPRAAHWTLDRAGVKGHEGESLLRDDESDNESDLPQEDDTSLDSIGALDVPNRKIYCIDLRVDDSPQAFINEVRRISDESSIQTVDLMQWINGNPKKDQLERYLHPQQLLQLEVPRSNENGQNRNGQEEDGASNGDSSHQPEPTKRRWYPVIDYDRCTNCMECIDFCLFGVYGIDHRERILVEQQDNCKKGCPACSRVCPENAIIFPGHKTPAIAGADGEVAGLKIDLSKLFGAPSKSALELAVEERDVELVRDGRDAVGMEVGVPKRQTETVATPRDALDDLMDGLDDFE